MREEVTGGSGPITFLRIRTQFENVGDALIIRELIRLLAQRGDVVLDLSGVPAEFGSLLDAGAMAGVSIIEGAGTTRILARAIAERMRGRRCFYFLVPGGISGEKHGRQLLSARAHTGFLRALSAAGVRVCQVGISYDSLGPRHARVLASRARQMYSHSVRDDESRHYAVRRGIRVDAVVPDLAFNLFASPTPPDVVQRAHVAFSFRRDKYPSRARDIDQAVRRILGGHDENTPVLFVSQVKRDDVFMRELCASVSHQRSGSVEFHSCSDDIEGCLSLYRRCEVVYSNRLHVLLLAVAGGAAVAPVIERTVDAKIAGLFGSLGLGGRVQTIDDVDGRVRAPRRSESDIWAQQAERLSEHFDGLIGPILEGPKRRTMGALADV